MDHETVTQGIVLNPASTAPQSEVTLMNFSDSPRVFNDFRNRPVLVNVGATVTAKLTNTTIERIKRRMKSIVVLTPDIADHASAPHMRLALDTLRNYSTMKEIDLRAVADKVFGRGFLGPTPKREEIRSALAKRCKDAAAYIQMGAIDAAEQILGRNNPDPEPVKGAEKEVEKSDLVQGDDEEDLSDDDGEHGDDASGDDAGSAGGDGETSGEEERDARGDQRDRNRDDDHERDNEADASAPARTRVRRNVRPVPAATKKGKAGKNATRRVKPQKRAKGR